MSKINDLAAPYPLIDADPHAGRVIRYMRPSDYLLWGAGTASVPVAIYGFGKSSSSHHRGKEMGLISGNWGE